MIYFLSKPAGVGDEALFIRDLAYVKTEGLWAAIAKGVSIPYVLLPYPFSLVLPDFVALRLVNVLLFGLLLLYFHKRIAFRNGRFYALLLFFFSTVGYFMAGTNDTLFSVSLGVFLIETYLLLSRKTSTFVWWGSAIVIAFFTRALILLFLPCILLGIIFLLLKKVGTIKTLLFPAILAIVFLLLNIPSLLQNKNLSYDQKLPPSGIEATWTQRQYYAQLLVNEGSLANYQHPSWEETDAYLQLHGTQSLPATEIEAILFDIPFTIKEFFKELLFFGIYGSRQMGLMLAVVLGLGILALFRLRTIHPADYIPLSLLGTAFIFCLLIISFLELRWFAPLFIASIFMYFQYSKDGKLPQIIIQANYIVVTLLSIYGCYGLFLKL
ncbi:hypothetical protein ACFQO1_04190 [Jejudonia soesokkakensis]|uniref:Glycosyltransferase RgtA/B/C/D-like domain-containing protein n=1 Tax=Jejudonia soesokkakensis TaxID=1323432 RepID=A0ABW2MS10_9FLAO